MTKEELSKKAREMVKGGATLLDVRTPEEFAQGHVDGAVNIPVQVLSQRVGEVPRGSVVVYCQMGGRSATAEQILRRNGFSDVFNLLSVNNW